MPDNIAPPVARFKTHTFAHNQRAHSSGRTRGFIKLLKVCGCLLALVLALPILVQPLHAQNAVDETALSSTRPIVPQQVRYSGKLTTRSGESVEAAFRIYAAAEGGEPLWSETQEVSVAADGAYSVLLGSATASGLSQTVFAGGAARWLGVTVERGEEQERVLLSTVPYAMNSADAELLAGHAAAEFATQDQLVGLATKVDAVQRAASASPALQTGIHPEASPGGAGTANTVPLWTNSTTLGNSIITQSNGKIGINFAAPTATLEVGGPMTVHGTLAFPPGQPATASQSSSSQTFTFSASAWNSTTAAPVSSTYTMQAGPTGNNTATPSAIFYFNYQNGTSSPINLFTVNGSGTLGLANPTGGILSNGNVNLKPAAIATATAATNSPLLEIGASSFSSSSNVAHAQTFAWQAQGSGNDTASPTGSLALLYGSNGATPAATGFSIAPNGQLTFASGQQFPVTGTGGGTITGITTTSPLTGSGTTGSVALGLNTSALETTLNGQYAQLAAANTFTGASNVFNNYIEASTPSAGQGFAVYAFGASGSSGGVYGNSDGSGLGLWGEVEAPLAGSTGVLGGASNNGGFSGTYATEIKYQAAGIWGDIAGNSGSYQAGVLGTADNADGGTFFNNSQPYATVFASNLYSGSGTSMGVSGNANTSGGIGVEGSASVGVWGIGNSNSGQTNAGIGVYGVYQMASTEGTLIPVSSGVWADTSVAGGQALLATADDGYAGTFLSSGNKVTLYAENDIDNDTTAEVFYASGGYYGQSCSITVSGVLSCSGSVGTNVSVADTGRQVQTYSVQSAESWFEDAGTVQLVRGSAHVDLEPVFGGTVNTGVEYHVFLTPDGDCKGLYVSQKSAGGFDVRELGGGKSSIAFEYRIMAKRTGYESARLVDVTDAVKREAEMHARNRSQTAVHPRMVPPVRPELQPGGPVRQVPHRPIPTPKAFPVATRAAVRPQEAK